MNASDIETLIQRWDGEEVIVRYDRPAETWMFMAIHSTRLGPPVSGGTRMKSYDTPSDALRDAMKLSSAMTNKLALAGVSHGGGKAVFAVPRDLDSEVRAGLLRRYGTLLTQLGGFFLTGPDVGTSPEDMDVIAETGAPNVFSRTPEAGGAGDSGPTTAAGVFAAVRVTCEWLFDNPSPAGKRVVVQGAGSVGRSLIAMLRDAGAEVLFSDVDDGAVRRVRDEFDVTFVPPDDVYTTPCDIFSPCALGGILNQTTIPRLTCRAVVGSANNQLDTDEDAQRLRSRDILYAPDIVINIGGLMGIIGMETEGWSRREAFTRVSSQVDGTLRRVYELADAEDLDTHTAALHIAAERLADPPDWRPVPRTEG